ncbi:MAG: WbuC family cupin fold metalloprotein [Prevotellaceae bacterium]|nr:WbuC family cupin fold metalloprotein [Prevotellaceae bacterium]
MKLIDETLLDSVSAQALESPRLRMNHNFHAELDDPVNRLLNAMEPGTYLPPHRHLNPDKNETFLVLRGSVAIFLFDDRGTLLSSTEVSPRKGVYGMELEAGVWHSLAVLEPATVVYEVKPGPFVPVSPENTAHWAPSPADSAAAEAYIEQLLNLHRSGTETSKTSKTSKTPKS